VRGFGGREVWLIDLFKRFETLFGLYFHFSPFKPVDSGSG
jgi:hypothetical protein